MLCGARPACCQSSVLCWWKAARKDDACSWVHFDCSSSSAEASCCMHRGPEVRHGGLDQALTALGAAMALRSARWPEQRSHQLSMFERSYLMTTAKPEGHRSALMPTGHAHQLLQTITDCSLHARLPCPARSFRTACHIARPAGQRRFWIEAHACRRTASNVHLLVQLSLAPDSAAARQTAGMLTARLRSMLFRCQLGWCTRQLTGTGALGTLTDVL